MSKTLISIWLCAIVITSAALGFTWHESTRLTPHKLAMIDKMLLGDREIADDNTVAILGASLVAHGFSADKITTAKLNEKNIALWFYRFHILSASPSELEAALLTVIEQNIEVILVDISPWLISYGFGENFTHHRHWLFTLMSEKLALGPHRYNQKALSTDEELSNGFMNNADKFNAFRLKEHRLFDKVENAITNSSSKILFYLPPWSAEAYSSFGAQKSQQLIKNAISFAKRYQVPLLSAPPQMAKTHYQDMAHVNRKGRKEYMNWLIKTVAEQR
jgi:hypothetical protein